MRLSQICSCVILIVLPIFILLSLLTSNNENEYVLPGPVPGSVRISKTKHGIAYDLVTAYVKNDGKLDTDDNFIVRGFVFYRKVPAMVKNITRNFRPNNSWLLQGENAIGNITLQNVQREQPRMEAVLVVVTYYMTWDQAVIASVTVTGRSFNRDTNEFEEESENLPDITAGELTKKGYCRKIVYFGSVDEVIIEGRNLNSKNALVLIANVKVVVGRSSEFDNKEELTCK